MNAPEHLIAELIDGELHLSPRPQGRHIFGASTLFAALTPFQQHIGSLRGWWIMFEPELHLREDILVPDLVGWRVERLPVYPKGPFVDVAPDWVCEVLSPSTRWFDRNRKLDVYARESVAHVWLVDPLKETVEVLRLQDSEFVIHAVYAAEDSMRAVPFEAVEIALAPLWDKSHTAAPKAPAES